MHFALTAYLTMTTLIFIERITIDITGWTNRKQGDHMSKKDEKAKGQDKRSVGQSEVDGLVINRFVYHYCAQYQTDGGSTNYIDGIAQLEERITCMDDYRKIKPLIEPVYHDKLCIMSLSFIGMEQGL